MYGERVDYVGLLKRYWWVVLVVLLLIVFISSLGGDGDVGLDGEEGADLDGDDSDSVVDEPIDQESESDEEETVEVVNNVLGKVVSLRVLPMDFVKEETIELDDSLQDGLGEKVELPEGEYLSNNTIYKASHSIEFFDNNVFESGNGSKHIRIGSGNSVMNYTIEFEPEVKSTLKYRDMVEVERTLIPLFGSNYYAFDVDKYEAVLIDSSILIEDLKQRESKVIEYDGKRYDVSVSYFGTNKAEMTVNGDQSTTLGVGSYQEIGGIYVVLLDTKFDPVEKIGSVKLGLGFGRMEMRFGHEITVNGEEIPGVRGHISQRGDGEYVKNIVVEWFVDEYTVLNSGDELELPAFGNVKLALD